jgi:hypothetical protein
MHGIILRTDPKDRETRVIPISDRLRKVLGDGPRQPGMGALSAIRHVLGNEISRCVGALGRLRPESARPQAGLEFEEEDRAE